MAVSNNRYRAHINLRNFKGQFFRHTPLATGRTEPARTGWSYRCTHAEDLLRPELTVVAFIDQPTLGAFLVDALLLREATSERACSSNWNRPVRIRMPGGVGRAVSNDRPYPIYAFCYQ